MQFKAVLLSLAGAAITLPAAMAQSNSLLLVTQISDGQIQAPVPTYGPVLPSSSAVVTSVMTASTSLTSVMGDSSSDNVAGTSASSAAVGTTPVSSMDISSATGVDSIPASSAIIGSSSATDATLKPSAGTTMKYTITLSRVSETDYLPVGPSSMAAPPSETLSATTSAPPDYGSHVSQKSSQSATQSTLNPTFQIPSGGTAPSPSASQGPATSPSASQGTATTSNPETPVSTSNGALTDSTPPATGTGDIFPSTALPSIVSSSGATSMSSFKSLAIFCFAMALGMQL